MTVSVVAGRPSVSPGETGITWAPVQAPVKLNFIGTSFHEVSNAISRALDQNFPVRLNQSHIPILRGMAAAAGDGHMPYTELLNALTQFGNLEVSLT